MLAVAMADGGRSGIKLVGIGLLSVGYCDYIPLSRDTAIDLEIQAEATRLFEMNVQVLLARICRWKGSFDPN